MLKSFACTKSLPCTQLFTLIASATSVQSLFNLRRSALKDIAKDKCPRIEISSVASEPLPTVCARFSKTCIAIIIEMQHSGRFHSKYRLAPQ